jgi:hypothetical protein
MDVWKVSLPHSKLAQDFGATRSQFKTAIKADLFSLAAKLLPGDPEIERYLNRGRHLNDDSSDNDDDDCSDDSSDNYDQDQRETDVIFERIQDIPLEPKTNARPEIILEDGPYDYQKGKWYVVFANKYLGGGYLNHGFVQEEILCFECPEMSMLIANHDLMIKGHRGRPESSALRPYEVALYTNLFRTIEISVYGREFDQYQSRDLKKFVSYTDDQGPLNFLALDAINVSRKTRGATKDDLRYMLDKATIGFQTLSQREVKSIHTGKWGCGAFGNDISDIFRITYLAAWYAGLKKVHFHLYDGKNRPELQAIINSQPSIADLVKSLNL